MSFAVLQHPDKERDSVRFALAGNPMIGWRGMIGAWLNTAAAAAGLLWGALGRRPPSPAGEQAARLALMLAALYLGGRTTVEGLAAPHGGGFLRSLLVLIAAMTVSKWLSLALRLQRRVNALGRFAAVQIAERGAEDPPDFNAAFQAATIVFCLNPLAFAGPILEGLSGSLGVILIKAIMDGFAAASFTPAMRRGAAAALIPLAALLNAWGLLARALETRLEFYHAAGALQAVCGCLTLLAGLTLLGERRIGMADYLPALILAPIFARLAGG